MPKAIVIYPLNYGANGEIVLVVDSQLHLDYGLQYPMTYEINIPNNSSDLSAHYKYKKNDGWTILDLKTPNDYFNGIEAVRFDYPNSKAYVSVAFSFESDSLIIFISNDQWRYIRTSYSKICKYYDNRDATVTATADDLAMWYYNDFAITMHEFRERNLWLSCGIITNGIYDYHGEPTGAGWTKIQNQIDSGYIEILSHSWSHTYPPYADLQKEVGGSKDKIISKLNLPPLFKSGNTEYVYAFVYPYGEYNDAIDIEAEANKYLVCRTVDKNVTGFSTWNSTMNIFNRVGETVELGLYAWTNLDTLNNSFDTTLAYKGIYHMILHPTYTQGQPVSNWQIKLNTYIGAHLDYIKGRKNIWYVSFGHLYLYNLLRINDVQPVSVQANINIFLEGSYSGANQMDTNLTNVIPNNQPYRHSSFNYQWEGKIC